MGSKISNSLQTSAKFICLKRPMNGYTIIECMICVAIIGLLSSIAIPSFAAMINKTRVTNASNDVLLTLVVARNQAITQGKVVLVCQTDESEPDTCSSRRSSKTNWASGWMVYVDIDGDNELSSSDSIVSKHSAGEDTAIVFNQRGRLRFFPDGSARSAGFYVCQANSDEVRHIRLLYSGRARISPQLGKKQTAVCKSKSTL